MYVCVRGIDIDSFYGFFIGCWKCSDNVVLCFLILFHCIHIHDRTFPGVRSGETGTSNIHIHDRSFLHVRSDEAGTSSTHIHDRSFPGVRSGETDTSNTHIHDRSFPHVRSGEAGTSNTHIHDRSFHHVGSRSCMCVLEVPASSDLT
jgi:hypothetical protein